MNYEKQAKDFLEKHHLTLTIENGPSKCPTWGKNDKYQAKCPYEKCSGIHGLNYWVTLRCGKQSYSFDFWASYADSRHEAKRRGDIGPKTWPKQPTTYDILSCISSDVACSYDDFQEFADSFGYTMKQYHEAFAAFQALKV